MRAGLLLGLRGYAHGPRFMLSGGVTTGTEGQT